MNRVRGFAALASLSLAGQEHGRTIPLLDPVNRGYDYLSHLMRAHAEVGQLDDAWRLTEEAMTAVKKPRRERGKQKSIALPGNPHSGRPSCSQDRMAAAAKLFEGFGGKIESGYWFPAGGEHDGFVITLVPDDVEAINLTVRATGMIPLSRACGYLSKAQ